MTDPERHRLPAIAWTVWVLAALLLLPVLGGWVYATAVVASALLLAAHPAMRPWHRTPTDDTRELVLMAVLYVGVVGLMRAAFVGFGTSNVVGLFLCFATALLLGVLGPVVYESWVGHRPLRALGIRWDNWRPTLALGLLFALVQFSLTLWGYDLPAPEAWVPLLVMALVVGVFESIFFRGFIQNRLNARYGPVVSVGVAALAYGAYHVGYGMPLTDIGFLTGLGVVYSVAFAIVRNVLVLWPLLTPLGSFFANVTAGDIELPWASIMGFADVAMLMGVGMWLAWRHHRKDRRALPPPQLASV